MSVYLMDYQVSSTWMISKSDFCIVYVQNKTERSIFLENLPKLPRNSLNEVLVFIQSIELHSLHKNNIFQAIQVRLAQHVQIQASDVSQEFGDFETGAAVHNFTRISVGEGHHCVSAIVTLQNRPVWILNLVVVMK
ncbi:Hypothetical_protein [Hexamita inflata]|uniref:Hypothetical_protein n=1 Tax=Hexamita inflata TaxID=28002 RepID=A0AA86N5T8_9EUKA|nr:Hypothetical protein HINF_LOCUS1018 [Hexamita inflata]